MPAVAAGILAFVKEAVGLLGAARDVDADTRTRIADYCDRVGDTLAQIVAELEAGRVPHGKCAQLVAYSDDFAIVAAPVLGAAEAGRVAAALRQNHDIERMAMEFDQAAERADAIRQLAEAAGRFTASAHRVRAGA